MSIEPVDPKSTEPAPAGLGYPTDELPTYHKVSGYPDPTQVVTPPAAPLPAGSTGQLPVSGSPVTAAYELPVPRGPYLPPVLRGIFILVVAALVTVWRLVDHPNWAAVGIGAAIGAGVLFLLAAAISVVVQRSRQDHEFDRMVSRS